MSDNDSKSCIIHIENEEIELKLIKNGLVSTKKIDIQTLTKFLLQINTSSDFFSHGCRAIGKDGELTHYCFESFPRCCPIKIEVGGVISKKEKVYFPNTLFIFTFYQKQLISSFCVCTQGTLNSLNDEVFRSPFGNTDIDGRICWGNNDLSRYHPANIDQLVELYYSSPFNGELDDKSLINIDLCVNMFDPKTLRAMGTLVTNFPQFRSH